MKDPSLMSRDERAIAGAAWDSGWNTAASCYWHKPRNPYTGEMNDDAIVYCPEHGGTAKVEVCEHDSHPVPEPPTCTCERKPGLDWMIGGHHELGCPLRMFITLPEVKASRGGIKFGGNGGTD